MSQSCLSGGALPGRAPTELPRATGEVEELHLIAAETKPPPEFPVKPTIRPDFMAKRDLTEPEKDRLVTELLPEIESLVVKLELPFARPVRAEHVKEVTAWSVANQVRALIVFTNGYQYVQRRPWHQGIWAPDVFFGVPRVRVRDLRAIVGGHEQRGDTGHELAPGAGCGPSEAAPQTMAVNRAPDI